VFYLLNLQETIVPILKKEEKQKDVQNRSAMTSQFGERSAITLSLRKGLT